MYCYAKELDNGIKIKSWYGKETDDEELRKLQSELEKWSKGVDILKNHKSLIETLLQALENRENKIDGLARIVSNFGVKIASNKNDF